MTVEKPLAPWKRELYQQADALDEPQEFQNGVVAGYHDAGVALSKAYFPDGPAVPTPEQVRKWAAGFAAGYIIRLELEARKKREQDDGATENTARVDV